MTCGILSYPRLGPLSEGSAGEPSLEQHGLGVLVQSYIPELALEAAEESHRRPEGDLSGDRHDVVGRRRIKAKLGFGDIGEDLVDECRQAARDDEIDSWLEFSRDIDFRGDRRKVGRQIKAALVPKAVWKDESRRLITHPMH
jgi:hypothetical protein